MPRNPWAPALANTSRSTIPAASHSSECGTSSFSRKPRTESRKSSWSDSKSVRCMPETVPASPLGGGKALQRARRADPPPEQVPAVDDPHLRRRHRRGDLLDVSRSERVRLVPPGDPSGGPRGGGFAGHLRGRGGSPAG